MCLGVVAVAVMLEGGRGSAKAMVEEAVTVAAEEAKDGGAGAWWLCTVFFSPSFFLPTNFPHPQKVDTTKVSIANAAGSVSIFNACRNSIGCPSFTYMGTQ
jgi:hypothetical protein